MIDLSEGRKDALQEVINIAFHRAAYALSELTERRIELRAPEIHILSVQELGDFLSKLIGNDIVLVNQFFQGSISGNALLIMNPQSALTLIELVTKEKKLPRLDESDKEVILEIGNILLNAYVGTLGNFLEGNIAFFVPNIRVETVGIMVKSLSFKGEHLHHAIAVVTEFVVKEANIIGCVVTILGVTSLEKLVELFDSFLSNKMDNNP